MNWKKYIYFPCISDLGKSQTPSGPFHISETKQCGSPVPVVIVGSSSLLLVLIPHSSLITDQAIQRAILWLALSPAAVSLWQPFCASTYHIVAEFQRCSSKVLGTFAIGFLRKELFKNWDSLGHPGFFLFTVYSRDDIPQLGMGDTPFFLAFVCC